MTPIYQYIKTLQDGVLQPWNAAPILLLILLLEAEEEEKQEKKTAGWRLFCREPERGIISAVDFCKGNKATMYL